MKRHERITLEDLLQDSNPDVTRTKLLTLVRLSMAQPLVYGVCPTGSSPRPYLILEPEKGGGACISIFRPWRAARTASSSHGCCARAPFRHWSSMGPR